MKLPFHRLLLPLALAACAGADKAAVNTGAGSPTEAPRTVATHTTTDSAGGTTTSPSTTPDRKSVV